MQERQADCSPSFAPAALLNSETGRICLQWQQRFIPSGMGSGSSGLAGASLFSKGWRFLCPLFISLWHSLQQGW